MPADLMRSRASSVAGEIEKSERTTVPSRSVTTASTLTTRSMIARARHAPALSGEVERRGRDAEARLRANPSVDHQGGTAREQHVLRCEQVSFADPVTAVAGGIVDQVTASLAGEFQKHVRIDHGADTTWQ